MADRPIIDDSSPFDPSDPDGVMDLSEGDG